MRTLTMLLAVALCLLGAGGTPERVEVPIPRPEPLLGMNLRGGLSSYIISSHLQTGWARYLETVPGARLANGVGSWTAAQQLDRPEDADRILGTLHRYGIGVFRHEMGWGQTAYRDDLSEVMRLEAHADAIYRSVLRASKAHGFRVIVLLNAHQGRPCGVRETQARFLAAASSDATEALLEIDDPSIIRLGYTGLSGLTHYCAAEGLFTAARPEPGRGPKAYRVTLTQQLQKDYAQGDEITVATLQYRPFGDPASDEETYAGWAQYADLLARIAQEEGFTDGEIDFEVWNELTFGTSFLSIGKYDPSCDGSADHNRMLELAASSIRRYFPAKTSVINGFANTSFFFEGFWVEARPAGIDAETYHPYGMQWRDFPKHAVEGDEHLRLAFTNVDGFIPRYGTLFPEYCGNYVTSHDIITLMQPEMRDLLVERGHAPAGWKRFMTENGMFLDEISAPEPFAAAAKQRPEHFVAKYWLRMYPFYLNKGLHAVCDGSLRNPGDWRESWERKFVETGDESHLAALQPLQRMMALFEGAIDVPPERLIQLRPRVWQLSGSDQMIFDGTNSYIITEKPGSEPERTWDPTQVEPRPLTYRDVFCLLPFQIDDSTLAIGAYIQTRNLLEDVTDAGRYEITFPGLTADTNRIRVYDPLADRDVAAEITSDSGAPSITLTLTDYPLWIILPNANGPRGGGPLTATAPPPY